ncbi:MAG: NAD(P)-dependent oxidoreductase [Candidatus Riflebacteria bacterium]|nr:NAD(P)-dependent oxidoreductase [Candidatus Riflebacteria bacterium]
MKVLLTGASGFIGSEILRQLLSNGHEVTAISLPDENLSEQNNLIILSEDLNNHEKIRSLISSNPPDAAIHLAWHVKTPDYLESEKNLDCLLSTVKLVKSLIECKCAHIAIAGTCAEYDHSGGYMSEDKTLILPDTLYAAAKTSCRLLCEQLTKNSSTKLAWLRIFYPYGPNENPMRLLPALIKSLCGNNFFKASTGDQIRDYIHVHDVASAFVNISEKKIQGSFNVSSGFPITIRSLLETTAEIMGKKDLIQFGALPPRPWDPPFICGNNLKLRSTGWQQKYPILQGLSNTIEWWKEKFDHKH